MIVLGSVFCFFFNLRNNTANSLFCVFFILCNLSNDGSGIKQTSADLMLCKDAKSYSAPKHKAEFDLMQIKFPIAIEYHAVTRLFLV